MLLEGLVTRIKWDWLRWIFRMVWWKWMRDYKIVSVTGWRSAVYDTKTGDRVNGMICLFPWD